MTPGFRQIREPEWASATQIEVVRKAIARLEQAEREIEAATLEEWKEIRLRFLRALESGFPKDFPAPGPISPAALDARVVSKHEFGDITVENILFRSAVGWQINGTVFRPRGSERLPGVVCPTGSSTKLNYPYWSSAQLIAKSGYTVLSYDPPGFVGERREGSDAFADAPLGYLTGLIPRYFFVADTTAAIDYLASRSDVDDSVGFAVTGLSLGAQTTANVAIHDDRIAFIAPVCGISSYFERLLPELYTVHCGEMVPGLIGAGMDYHRRLSLFAPRRCLLVSGARDEIETPETTTRVFDRTRQIYRLYGAESEFELFIDESADHTYSPAMVNEVATRLDEVLVGAPRSSRPRYGYTKVDVIEIPREAMMARPDTSLNISTLNSRRAVSLAGSRTGQTPLEPSEAAARLARLLAVDSTASRRVSVETVSPPVRSWVHDFTRLSITGDGYSVPALLVAREGSKGAPGLLFIDERGIWAGIRQNGYLAKAFRFLDRSTSPTEPVVLAIDASGFGSLAHRESAYDATSWSDPDGTLAYLAIATGIPVAGLRVRDTLAALESLAGRSEVDRERLMVAGIGEGAITALFASVIHGGCARTILVDPPLGFTEMVTSGRHSWLRSSFVPGILEHFDLADLVLLTGGDVHIVRPLDAMRRPSTITRAREVYRDATVHCPSDESGRDAAFVEAVLTANTSAKI